MLNALINASTQASTLAPPVHAAPLRHARYRGPERRAAHEPLMNWFAMMLDEIDYGMLLLGEGGQVLHLNHAARCELDDQHPLVLKGQELHARNTADAVPLAEALQAASGRSLRRLVTLGNGQHGVSVAVVPLPAVHHRPTPAALVVLGKRHMCVQLSVQWFARSRGLTSAETRVLEALCAGHTPAQIAASHGVGIATVRTQIGSIREKTGAGSINQLVRKVAVLPPLVGALRSQTAASSGAGAWPENQAQPSPFEWMTAASAGAAMATA